MVKIQGLRLIVEVTEIRPGEQKAGIALYLASTEGHALVEFAHCLCGVGNSVSLGPVIAETVDLAQDQVTLALKANPGKLVAKADQGQQVLSAVPVHQAEQRRAATKGEKS